MYDIILGRSASDKSKMGDKGTVLLGKHYVQMGKTVSLSNKIYLDVTRSHVVLVCGKRGSGKSYTMGVVAEGISDLPSEISQNLAVVIFDTMGIYWTMKYPNKKDAALLKEWGLSPKALDIKIYTPSGFFKHAKEKGIPTDFPFSIKPSELTSGDWLKTFDIKDTEPAGVLIEKVIYDLKDKGADYGMNEIINAIAESDAEHAVKDAAKNRFFNASKWGIFSEQGTPMRELAKPGQVTVLDLSAYATISGAWNIKALAIGLISQKLFNARMASRKDEEYQDVHKSMNYFGDEEPKKASPMVWLVVDEAHEFLPLKGTTAASAPLITILREGRQPGISLILATQQPGKIHTDVMTQSDIILSHRVTAKIDTDALAALVQSYMRAGLDVFLNQLPRETGAAIVLDDTNEKMFPIRVRPRFTWHGGESPTAFSEKKKEIFE